MRRGHKLGIGGWDSSVVRWEYHSESAFGPLEEGRRDDLESTGWEEFDRHGTGDGWTTYQFRRRRVGADRRR